MSQNMTKIVRDISFAALLPFLTLVLWLVGCADESSGEPVILPQQISSFVLYPNDVAANDSASNHVSNGLQILVHPKVSYALSFDRDSSIEETPVLQLFRFGAVRNGDSVTISHVRTLEAREEDGRLVYEFFCEEQSRNIWVSSLVLDGGFYKGTTRHARLTAEGTYSDTLSLNLVVTGKIDFIEDDMTVEKFAKQLLDGFRTHFTSVTIDTLYVRYANEHPTLGSKYPANEPWLAGRSSSDYFVTELGGWPEAEVKNALDIVLVHRIELDWVLGYSLMYSGNLSDGNGSTVVIGAYNKTPKGELGVTSASMVATAVHESGHFFGLRHTTSTQADFNVDFDYSNYEDGFSDTPYCPGLLKSGLLKKHDEDGIPDYALPNALTGRFAASPVSFDVADCPDATNMMFPAVNDSGSASFTAQQLEHIRKNLMVFPH